MTCTECGKSGAMLVRLDASNVIHWFHAKCWASFCGWLQARLPGEK